MSHFEDEEHTEFFAVGKSDGGEVVLSRAAFTLSAAGISQSIKDGTPGFISDDYLSAIEAETTLTAMELVAAGDWERVEGGYRVTDPSIQEFAENLWLRQHEFSDWPLSPEECDSHRTGPNTGGRCLYCGTPVED